jgi:F0F1-type ATP synthase assembly protein I
VFGIVGGLLLDGLVDTKPVFTLIGLFLGLILAFFGGYLLVLEELGLRRPPQKDK